MRVPFNKPYSTGKEWEYMKDAIERLKISGDGYYSKKVEKFMEEKFHTHRALFVTSCTSALDMASILLDLKPTDEVIVPSYTFVSTANAIALRNAKIIFADIDPNTLNIDPKDIERKITHSTKAIFPVHYAGISCDMNSISKIAQQNNLEIVEDAAQGVNALYNDQYLGTIGSLGCYSFHETKNYICGEGGALLINNPKFLQRAEIIREKGTNRSQFFRGEVDKYTWVDIGSSYVASDLLAAYLWAQFEQLNSILETRKKIFDFYFQNLKPLEDMQKPRLPIIPKECKPNYHLFYILLNSAKERDRVMDGLKKMGVNAIFHYVPLHTSPMGKKMGYKEGDLPITEDYAARLLRLPFYNEICLEDCRYVVDCLKILLECN